MSVELTSKNVHLAVPSVLVEAMEAVARAEGKTLDEIAGDALRRFLQDRQWQQLVSYGKVQAQTLGLTSDDVPRLIGEARRERER